MTNKQENQSKLQMPSKEKIYLFKIQKGETVEQMAKRMCEYLRKEGWKIKKSKSNSSKN
jgi:glutamine synthetase